jgi:protein ImuB
MARAVAVVHLRGEVSDARHSKVLEALTRLLPKVGVEGRGLFACDLRGTERLLGPAERVGERIVATLERVKIPCAVGIAERPFAARVAAERAPAGGVVRIRRGEERAFLSVLPVTALPLDDEMRDELALLGVRTVGAFADLDGGAVLGRFGRAAALAHALARGEDTGEVRGTPPKRRVVARRAWDSGVAVREQLLFILKSLLDEVAAELTSEGIAALRLEARFEREDAAPLRIERVVLPPTAEASALLRSLRWGLEEVPEVGQITGARVEVTDAEPARGRQIGLFAPDAANEEEATSVARYLRSRLGSGAVLRAHVSDAEAPVAEREAEWEEAVS